MDSKSAKAELFKALTLTELMAWAGITILSRGKNYQRNHRVTELAYTPEGGLIAWVTGTERYVTAVDIQQGGKLSSTCTCPYWTTCKHAVAVILEYMEQARYDHEVPTATAQDPRLIQGKITPIPETTCAPQILHSYLEKQTKAQLIDFIEELAKRYTEVHAVLQDRCHLASGAIDKMVSIVRTDIARLAGKEYKTASYSPPVDILQLQERLESLLGEGYADKVVELGRALLKAGARRVETDYEDDSAWKISDCMKVVFQALPHSSLSVVEQMLWTIDIQLADEYDLCKGIKLFWERAYTPKQWSDLADVLMERLKRPLPAHDKHNISIKHQCDQLVNWIIRALDQANRQTEIIPLCQAQVDQTYDGYSRLVTHLLKVGRVAEAETWIRKGIAATQKDSLGVAKKLRDMFLEMQKITHHHAQVAALRADEFLHAPSLYTFQMLQKAAKQADVLTAVRTAALHYLETGQDLTTDPTWPLPAPAVTLPPKRYTKKSFPDTTTLISIAIDENRPDEVVRWYEQRKPGEIWSEILDNQVAKTIMALYPDKAIEIWKKIVARFLSAATVKAYQQAMPYLIQIKQLFYKLNQELGWQAYIEELRQHHARKHRLIKLLDGLKGK